MEQTAEQVKARFVKLTDAITGAAIYFAGETIGTILDASGNAASVAVFKDGRTYSLMETPEEYFAELARCWNEINRQNAAIEQEKFDRRMDVAARGFKKSE